MSTQNSIFRQASLERVSSPEQLNEYIKVSRPSVWLILASVSVLLVGVLVWGVFGTLTTTRDAVAVAESGHVTCYLRPEEAAGLTVGVPVQIGSSTGTVSDIAASPIAVPADFDAYALYLSGFQTSDFVVPIAVDITVPDGVYQAKLTLEKIRPIFFVIN